MTLRSILRWICATKPESQPNPQSASVGMSKASTSVVNSQPILISAPKHNSGPPLILDPAEGKYVTSVSPPIAALFTTSATANESAIHFDAEAEFSNSWEYPQLALPRPLFALLIGIDKYTNYPPLTGAAKDVKDIEYFLMKSLSVPEGHITKLLDHDATTSGIIKGVRALTDNVDIKPGDAILIYFAGHGARAKAPRGWDTEDGYVETICPVDMSSDLGPKPLVTGIPDLVLNGLITQLAEKKGDNITVIFDCCHSANGLRGEHVVAGIRGIDNPPPLSADWGNAVPIANYNRSRRAVGLQSLECSVLLAACGRLERAGEGSEGGLFTQRLLTTIRGLKSDRLFGLTYKDLIRSLSISDSQHPQCEGSKLNRYLFRSEISGQAYIYGCKGKCGEFLLDAGKSLGIEVGTEFDIYRENSFSPNNSSCGRLKVKSASRSNSTLFFANGAPPFAVPNPFYAIQAYLSESQKIKIYCTDSDKLNQILLLHQRGFSGFATLVDVPKKANLLVSFGDCECAIGSKCETCRLGVQERVCFNWADDNVISQRSSSHIGRPISVGDPENIIQVIQFAARFHYYLYIEGTGANVPRIEMGLHYLQSEEIIIDGFPIRIRKPKESNLLEDEIATIQLERGKQVGPFGLNISNYTDKHLFPQVFWFEGHDLTITPWYTSQRSAGFPGTRVSIEAPLRACQINHGKSIPGEFHVGYGEAHVTPWGFKDGGTGNTVGFFKLFLTTFNADYSSLAQKSPFDYLDGRDGFTWKCRPTDWWSTRRATVVQLSP